ncbi:MAG: MarR family transcriptional regulator [Methanobacterium sp.]|uniref:MarR family winged helix-turn-helix transcriptional regulator n=1 Tax=Methanobacterium sp. TaxID=2164 RepID=UPI003D6621FC|nr:MarR family transcriptional regulator [Methanobacterium sp.]
MNRELELVESMDKLSELTRDFQKQLLRGDLKEYTLRKLYYIELINKNKGINVSELSKVLNVKKSTVSVAINQLIDDGIVMKTQSQTDKRFYSLQLTSKGDFILNKHMEIHKNTIKKILEILNEEEVDIFIKIVNKINALKL